MANVLLQIKRLVLRRQIVWTAQSDAQMAEDNLSRDDVIESIINARRIISKRSTSPRRAGRRERVYIIVGVTLAGFDVYTKGTIRRFADHSVFYVIISAKRSRAVL